MLRKQKSLIGESNCSQPMTTRERRLRLQKQFSVDQNVNTRDSVGASFRPSNGHSTKFINSITSNSNSWISNEPTPEASLRIFTAFKNKAAVNGYTINEEPKKLSENTSLAKKGHGRNEEKININIFLAHNIPELDLLSDTESPVGQSVPPKSKNDSNHSASKAIAKNSAETRRSQFRNQKSASLNERPRLTRAMSAPIRPNPSNADLHQANILNCQQMQATTVKKRLRRKKIVPLEIEQFDLRLAQNQCNQHHYQSKWTTERAYDERPTTAKSYTSRSMKLAKPSKASTIVQPRARSAVCSDIVTLVSLLSPGASDSEKEDYSTGTSESTNDKHKPSLRKVGKSDDENVVDEEPIVELPPVLRRATLVPLAAKIRLNRPPTAPPGLVFLRPTVTSDKGMNTDKIGLLQSSELKEVDATNEELATVVKKPPLGNVARKSSIDVYDESITYPEYVRSIKEKECWLLFQKMVNKGIAVSYETIMRGMLTPTEVRAVEKKQKEITERQASLELDTEVGAVECDSKK